MSIGSITRSELRAKYQERLSTPPNDATRQTFIRPISKKVSFFEGNLMSELPDTGFLTCEVAHFSTNVSTNASSI